MYLIAQPRFETWVYLLNFLSTDLLTHTNLKEALQKGTETRWMSHWISMSKGKYYRANSEITLLFRESGWQYNIQQTWKKDKHQVPLIPPLSSLFPKSDTLKQDQAVCHGHWPVRTQAGCRQEQWCKLDQNEFGLGVILTNYPFSPLNFSYTFSHQILTILLEPMPLPVYFQLNDICPWQWTKHLLLPSLCWSLSFPKKLFPFPNLQHFSNLTFWARLNSLHLYDHPGRIYLSFAEVQETL